MLLDRAGELDNRIEQFQKVKTAARDAQPFDTRARQLSKTADRIRNLQNALAALHDEGIPLQYRPANAPSLAEKASQLRILLAEDPTAIHDPPFDLRHEFIDRLNAIAQVGQETANSAWREHVLKHANLEAEGTLKVLATLPQLKAGVDRIRRNRDELVRLSEALPDNLKASLELVDVLVGKLWKSWEELDADDIPEEVISFIRLSAEEGAPLSALKENVVEWLTDRGLTASFRVRLS